MRWTFEIHRNRPSCALFDELNSLFHAIKFLVQFGFDSRDLIADFRRTNVDVLVSCLCSVDTLNWFCDQRARAAFKIGSKENFGRDLSAQTTQCVLATAGSPQPPEF